MRWNYDKFYFRRVAVDGTAFEKLQINIRLNSRSSCLPFDTLLNIQQLVISDQVS